MPARLIYSQTVTLFEPESLRHAARTTADWYASWLEGLEDRRVDPCAEPGALRGKFAGTVADVGIGLERAIEEVRELVVPHSMTTPHPQYLGLINSSPLPGAPLADLIVSALNNNCGASHQSPALTAAEGEVVRAFAALFECNPADGLIVPGGTYANLHGLLMARAHAFPGWRRDGVAAIPNGATLYTSEAAHFSIARAAQVLGFGERQIVAVPGRGRGEMDVAALAARITTDRRDGATPFAVVATVGTTGTGAIDPLAAIAQVCRREEVWFHVDACYGGAAALVRSSRDDLDGVELADSLAVDPHKWFFIPVAAGLLLTRHGAMMRECFATQASYIPDAAPDDAFLRGVATSRRGSGFTVWFALRAHGWQPIREAVQRNIDLTRTLEALLAKRGFRVLAGGRLSTACARFEPDGWDPERLDALQAQITATAVASGQTWFATVRHEGRRWLRLNMVNLHTRERHVRAVANLLTGIASELVD
ncbi:MAG: pyridoxal-dependent decarboxylase [Planctomycetota bacterium]